MKKSFFMIAALIMLTACGDKKDQVGKSGEDGAVTDSTEILAQEEITGVINDIYTAAAKHDVDIDQRYACHTWRKMVAAVEEKDSHLPEIGFFNDDYWTQMQDGNPDEFEIRDIKFESLDVEKGKATVSFTLYSSIQTVRQKFEFCREDSKWRVHNIIRFYNGENGKEEESNLMEEMKNYLDEPLDEMQDLTFADVAGIYDDADQESRIGLCEDGTATWNMIGSLHYTQYTYTINGHTICLKLKDVDAEEDCYEYDEDTRTLKNEQGEVYYRETVEK